MKEVRVSEIVFEDRARTSYGWLDSLERSIEQVGVLQPIGITKDKRLIFGGRRLQACKNLGIETIPARVFDIDTDDLITALRMEREENEHRRDLTPSEKVELARRIEEALAGRRGNPTGANQYSNGNPQNFAEFQPQGESRDIAAQAVNMNRETYRQAKAVVESGNQKEIQAMDSGEKSINAAYKDIKPDTKKPPRQEATKQETIKPKVLKITLHENPESDANLLLAKGGHEYCTKLAIAILKAAGHEVVQ